MNRAEFSTEGIPPPSWTPAAESFILNVLKALGLDNWELSVVFCGNLFIKSLNAQYRNKDEPTDVLSFPLGDTVETENGRAFLAGDIIVSLDALRENARFFGVSEDEELRRLLVHGVLHLSGADHATNGAEEPMLKSQEEILGLLKGVTIMQSLPSAPAAKTPRTAKVSPAEAVR